LGVGYLKENYRVENDKNDKQGHHRNNDRISSVAKLEHKRRQTPGKS
jgi:hypothetical protein